MTKRLTIRPAAMGLVSLLLLVASPLQAMTVRLMNLREQTQAAGMILAGTVTKVESRRDEHSLPATFITMRRGAPEELPPCAGHTGIAVGEERLAGKRGAGRRCRSGGTKIPSIFPMKQKHLFTNQGANKPLDPQSGLKKNGSRMAPSLSRAFAPQASVVASGVRDDVSRHYTCFIRRGEDKSLRGQQF